MLTGELRSKIDNVWNAFWAGGIANPIEVIEQITYLLFMRGLDDAHTLEENAFTIFGRGWSPARSTCGAKPSRT
jgi:type I restriction enzyme M protein